MRAYSFWSLVLAASIAIVGCNGGEARPGAFTRISAFNGDGGWIAMAGRTQSGGATAAGGTAAAGGSTTAGVTAAAGGTTGANGGQTAGANSPEGGATTAAGGNTAVGGASSTGATGTGGQAQTDVRGCASISVDPSGAYSVTFKTPNWTFAGDLGAPASGISATTGSDKLGGYCETSFTYSASGNRSGRIRAYAQAPVVVFGETSADSVTSTRDFPALSTVPVLPYHITYQGPFIDYSMRIFNGDSPWVFFDASANAFIISGASHFQNTQTAKASGRIVSGIQSDIKTLPAGFEQTTVLVADTSINRAFENWGHALLTFSGKTPVANDATAVLAKYGYWTDNTSAYYYKTQSGFDYQTTLKNVKTYFEQQGVPLAYMQLDSWWYPKGSAQSWSDTSTGIYLYQAAPELFPDGLAAFRQSLDLPLLTHSRWIDTSSPYRTQYTMSGNVVIDPAYWTSIAAYLKSSGVITFEQDWLSVNGLAATNNLTDQDAYLDNMAKAMADTGIDIQYCMPWARHILQSTKYPNLTNSRVSDDGFDRTRWRTFLYGSRLAWAVGLWPWTDVFPSSDHDSLLLSTLTAGVLGGSDAIGSADIASIKRAIRADGVIIKPDVPILLLDRSIVDEASAAASAAFATTYTQHAGGRFTYVFSFTDTDNVTASFTPAELGYTGRVYVYDVNNDSGKVLDSTQASSTTLASTSTTAYYVVAPIGSSGIALLGEPGKIAPVGKQRISAFSDDGSVAVTVEFGTSEGPVTLQGYAPAAPTVTATSGTVGAVSYSSSTQRFTVPVTASGTTATIRFTP